MKGLFITGTDTSVGKTHIACAIARQLRQANVLVAPRKPVESGCQVIQSQLIPSDATALKIAAEYQGSIEQICPFRFEPAISPQRAAKLAQQEISTQSIAEACLRDVNDNEFLLVEGAGGFYSPLCKDGLNADLAEALSLPLILVAEDKLGCINHVLLTLEAIKKRGLSVHTLVLNQVQPANQNLMDNIDDLNTLVDTPILHFHFQQTELHIASLLE